MSILERKCFVFPSQRGTFYSPSLRLSSSLRIAWVTSALTSASRPSMHCCNRPGCGPTKRPIGLPPANRTSVGKPWMSRWTRYEHGSLEVKSGLGPPSISIAGGEPRVKHRKGACIMAEQRTIEVGNAIIVLSSTNDPFSDGHTTGYLECYDERHRPAFPLTSHTVRDHLQAIMPSLWKAGCITGWMEALMENSEHTFRSVLPEGQMTVL